MRAASVSLVAFLLLAGCTNREAPEDPPSENGEWFPQEPVPLTYYLKAGYGLSLEGPNSSAPQRVPSNPVANGFANEDLEAFTSTPIVGYNVSHAKLIVYYEVDYPMVDPFRNPANPTEARHFVFWLGSNETYPMYVQSTGSPVLLPDHVYKAEARFTIPAGGWIVPRNESLQLLVATLAVNADSYDVNFLVDHRDTPSRIELNATSWPWPEPTKGQTERKEFAIPGNSGLFTGAGDAVPSKVEHPIPIPPNASHFRIEVRWISTAAGKSDLDFVLYNAARDPIASSTTPFQNETIRLFAPNLVQSGAGPFVAEVTAYSGANTRFALIWTWEQTETGSLQ